MVTLVMVSLPDDIYLYCPMKNLAGHLFKTEIILIFNFVGLAQCLCRVTNLLFDCNVRT